MYPWPTSSTCPESWASDDARRSKTGVPEEIQFQTKPRIALDQIPPCGGAGYSSRSGSGRRSLWHGRSVPRRPAGTATGICSGRSVFGERLGTGPYAVSGQAEAKDGAAAEICCGAIKIINRSAPDNCSHRFAGDGMGREVSLRREGSRKLCSRFAAIRVLKTAHRDYWRSAPHPEEWLLIEWPKGAWRNPQNTGCVELTGGNRAQRDLVRIAISIVGSWNATTRNSNRNSASARPLRRPRLARLSSSRHAVYRRLRVPHGRAKPFFFLGACRQTRTTRTQSSPAVRAVRHLPCATNGIIQPP